MKDINPEGLSRINFNLWALRVLGASDGFSPCISLAIMGDSSPESPSLDCPSSPLSFHLCLYCCAAAQVLIYFFDFLASNDVSAPFESKLSPAVLLLLKVDFPPIATVLKI